MIPNAKLRIVESSGVTDTGVFGISAKDTSSIMNILRDTLYTDKVMAVLREYSANAWDANREVGKFDVPIKVTLPTALDPVLLIRDFGPGLSPEDMFSVYTQYGASTKRGSNVSVGMLGIGSKSAFAYSDSFNITSWNGGYKRIYVAALDASEKGTMSLIYEEPCALEETGVEISIAVRVEDIEEFRSKAEDLYEHFEPKPDINLDFSITNTARVNLKSGVIFDDSHAWRALMGCISYRVDLDQVNTGSREGKVPEYFKKLGGYLNFNIGEVQIAANREELRYSDLTKDAIIKKVEVLIEEYVLNTITELKNTTMTPWARRCRANVLERMGLPIPTECKDIVVGTINLSGRVMKTFTLTKDKVPAASINVYDDTRILIRDDDRPMVGYEASLGRRDYIIKKFEAATEAEMRKELDELIDALNINGIPVEKMSEAVTWYVPPAKQKKINSNKKHKVTTFRLLPDQLYQSTKSDRWGVETRTPTKEDVYVIISGFVVEGDRNFFTTYKVDAAVAEMFGGKMPTIYGYKTTKKKPVYSTSAIGAHYADWRKEFFKSLLSEELLEILRNWGWVNILGGYDSEDYVYNRALHKKKNKKLEEYELPFKKVKKLLGRSHIITNFFEQKFEAAKFLLTVDDTKLEKIDQLKERVEIKGDPRIKEARNALKEITSIYPLIGVTGSSVNALHAENGSDWATYIKLVDASREED